MNVPIIPNISPLWHYRISRLLNWLPKIPIFGKVIASALTLLHVIVVYGQVLQQGESEWKQKNARTVGSKSVKQKLRARLAK